MTKREPISDRQQLFQTMFVGVLLYSIVLGFFNDYTDILRTTSYSTTFLVAIVMQLLTFATFWLKNQVKRWFKGRESKWSTFAMVFGVWLILFFSKFVFLAVIDVLFGTDVEISGFVGLLLIIISLTVAQKLAEVAYNKLAD
jgi:hypothetical protein